MNGDSFLEFVLDQLRGLDGVRAQRMFGGHGLYRHDVFFGIVHGRRLYFKTDEESRSDYARRGMEPFRPSQKQTLKSYYEVPPDVIENDEQLVWWGQRAVSAQSA